MRSAPILFLLLLFLGSSPSPVRATPFDEANAAFASGDYAKAAATSRELIASQGPSAARLYHLGNAQFKLGQFGPAILSYERAALLAPRDRDIQTNLKAARKAASTPDSAPTLPWWRMPLSWLSLREWSFLTVSGLLLIALPLLTWALFGLTRRPWLRPAAQASLTCGLLLALPGIPALITRSREKSIGIITAEKPSLRLSPFPEATATDSPGTGRRVIITGSRPGWYYLTIEGSTATGWMPASEVAPLIPEKS